MNSRERVLATLDHRQADRVPIAEMWIDPNIVLTIIKNKKNDNRESLSANVVNPPF